MRLHERPPELLPIAPFRVPAELDDAVGIERAGKGPFLLLIQHADVGWPAWEDEERRDPEEDRN